MIVAHPGWGRQGTQALDMVAAVNSMLQGALGFGLERFLPKKRPANPPHRAGLLQSMAGFAL